MSDNEERAIIVHTQLVKQCVSVGRSVIDAVRASGGELTDEKLEELFKPLITFVEEGVEARVRQETDEVRAKIKEQEELDAKEDRFLEIQANIEERVVLNVNGKRKDAIDERQSKRLRMTLLDPANQELFPEMKTVKVDTIDAPFNPDEINKDPEFYVHDTDAEYWENKYCSSLNVSIEEPGQKLIQRGLLGLMSYIRKKKAKDTPFPINDAVKLLAPSGLFTGSYVNTSQTLTFLTYCHKVLTDRSLLPEELLSLLSWYDKVGYDRQAAIKLLAACIQDTQ